MFRSLRSRLVLSHILPLVIIVPLMTFALSYLLETRFLIPKLTEELLENARLLKELTRTSYPIYDDAGNLQLVLVRLDLNPKMRVVFLQPDGTVAFSNDPDFLQLLGDQILIPGMERAQNGEEVVMTNYSFLMGGNDTIQVLLPVVSRNKTLQGVLWMTYYESKIKDLFRQFRQLSLLAIIACLIVGAVLGSLLALSIGNPVRQVTEAINGLARGERSQVLVEQGPEEIRQLARAVNILVAQLNSLEQARRQLLANLVHELGRPLGALRSAIHALAHGAEDDPALFKDLTSGMDDETARLQDLLNELAHLHDEVLGALELKREPTAMSEWLPNVLIPWQEAANQKHVMWNTEIPGDLPVMQVDQTRFAQVVGNLASNAVKYTPSGGKVSISAGKDSGEVWIRFQDSGPGVLEQEQEKIFQPFYRGSTGRRIKQGMGLGLSIARDLITAHGGSIELESKAGKGSTFTIWLAY